MNITSAINKVSAVGYEYVQIVVNEETIDVPKNIENSTYAEILRQVEAGELTIADAD